MNKKVRVGVSAVLLFGVIIGGGMTLYKNFQYEEGEKSYIEAEEIAGVPNISDVEAIISESDDVAESYVDPYAELLKNMDFKALREVNSDIIGWISIPGLISYPILQTTNNDYYLKRDYKKSSSVVGAIFMDYMNSPDFGDFNTIVYGHRMNNGSMFGSLKYYKNYSTFAAHPCVYITTDSGCATYQIFAAYEISTQGDTYKLGITRDETKQSYIDYCLAEAAYDTGVVPTVNDRILTLSTCTGNGHATRWVVQARLKGEAPEEDKSEQTAPVEEPSDLQEKPVTTSEAEDDSESAEPTQTAGEEPITEQSEPEETIPDDENNSVTE